MIPKIKTLVIAPYRGLTELTNSLKGDLPDFDITVLQLDLLEVLPMIGHLEKEGYDAIISRGGTATLLRQHSALPVIDIQVSGYDILRMLVLVKDYKQKMEIIGFPNIIDGFISVSGIMNIHMPYQVTFDENEVDAALARARDNGVKLVLGDHSTAAKAAEYGIQGVLITSGKESVLEAFSRAKHIRHIAQSFYAMNETYESMFNFLDEGVAVVDRVGMLHFANKSFSSMFKLPPPELKDRSLFDSYPFLEHMIKDIDNGVVYGDLVTFMDPDRTFLIAGGKLLYNHKEDHFCLKVTKAQVNESDIVVSYAADLGSSFPPLLVEGRNAAGETVNPEGCGLTFPYALYGEKGSGRRLFAGAHLRGNHGQLIELNISKVSDPSLEVIGTMIRNSDNHSVIYMNGIENAGVSCQKAIYKMLTKSHAKVVLAFERDPKILSDIGALEPQLYDMIKNQAIRIPPLRERAHDLEGLIRSFIIHYNVTFGKQIVGIRPAVLTALSSHAWAGNLIELREMVKQFIMHTDGEYISEDVLPALLSAKDVSGKPNSGRMNLNRTLDEIERDIITAVLEEENMNQTKAAKRLGINRSTLWRKIKQDGE